MSQGSNQYQPGLPEQLIAADARRKSLASARRARARAARYERERLRGQPHVHPATGGGLCLLPVCPDEVSMEGEPR
jgi:hypothetical protein